MLLKLQVVGKFKKAQKGLCSMLNASILAINGGKVGKRESASGRKKDKYSSQMKIIFNLFDENTNYRKGVAASFRNIKKGDLLWQTEKCIITSVCRPILE